jgi:hypothetical protein
MESLEVGTLDHIEMAGSCRGFLGACVTYIYVRCCCTQQRYLGADVQVECYLSSPHNTSWVDEQLEAEWLSGFKGFFLESHRRVH